MGLGALFCIVADNTCMMGAHGQAKVLCPAADAVS